jgi:hypothetical protein
LTDDTPTPELETEIISSYEQGSPEFQEYYRGAEFKDMSEVSPWHLSRAWRVVIAIRDWALVHEDERRALVYSQIAGDIASLLSNLGMPIPTPDGSGVEYMPVVDDDEDEKEDGDDA